MMMAARAALRRVSCSTLATSRAQARALATLALPSSERLRRQHALIPAARRGKVAVSAEEASFFGVPVDEKYNVPPNVKAKMGKDLVLRPSHPLGIVLRTVQEHFTSVDPSCRFFDREFPIVSTQQCFDDLLVPPDHISRSPSDTYYVNAGSVLRTHTSAHQCQYMRRYPEIKSFLVSGDVYRRDEIDASHHPVFHQCEGVRLFSTDEMSPEEVKEDLQRTLEGLAGHLFGLQAGSSSMRWNADYFPFTDPSFELEILYNEAWLEVLGCGVIHPDVMRNAGLDPEKVCGWAFGLGLERLAMVLFGIPDIRLFWSEDPRFSEQFTEDAFVKKTKFQPFSKYPPVAKDISMWIQEGFIDNDLFEVVRDEGGDQVEKVELIDSFTHPKTKRSSKAYRVTWRDMSRTLTHEEVNAKHEKVLARVVTDLGVELR
eukprot:gnl/TRDRNA2_/TRDRNA2_130239_c0_seq1.p1 gnl/TRDRNA2_/TRDRNA2_130239_c0~~gnl/TRDRNA2_/TRDRNA2_130239_c0_seq1.p1  ORF type:complete len:429 (+),score=71.34 gnl/TRDRNA2_/TRDRNA2_130239_c0_seq1:126-1412(+)